MLLKEDIHIVGASYPTDNEMMAEIIQTETKDKVKPKIEPGVTEPRVLLFTIKTGKPNLGNMPVSGSEKLEVRLLLERRKAKSKRRLLSSWWPEVKIQQHIG